MRPTERRAPDNARTITDFAKELAAWIGPLLVEAGLVKVGDDEPVQDIADALATEALEMHQGPLVGLWEVAVKDGAREHEMLDYYGVPRCGDIAHRINELGQMYRRLHAR